MKSNEEKHSITIEILRTDRSDGHIFYQKIPYEYEDDEETVATALRTINNGEYTDTEGRVVEAVEWECSCLQEKCGACAMRINGTPTLACAYKLSDAKGDAKLEPLRKFPVIADLKVDRSVLHESLREMKLWLSENADINADEEDIYEGMRCLQCGCCLEVCPNYYAGGDFAGMAGMSPASRVIAQETDREKYKEDKKIYSKKIYEGCGKSLACRNICPAHIDIDRLLVKSNAYAIWNRRKVKN